MTSPAPRLTWPLLAALLWLSGPVAAQPIGTFSWQLQPFCNRVTVNVTDRKSVV